nr:MAG TPA: hypothetical protein [Caudoviricetes sp.]
MTAPPSKCPYSTRRSTRTDKGFSSSHLLAGQFFCANL